MAVTVEVTVLIDDEERIYEATKDDLKNARFHAEKKARAFLRRKGLSVRMDNVVKERCPDCETKTIIKVHDLEVPDRQEGSEMGSRLDNLDWLLEVYDG